MKLFIVLSLVAFTVSGFHLRGRSNSESHNIAGRIYNGKDASPSQFPYQVGLSLKRPSGTYWCGGSLINNQWVLTAAHCVENVIVVRVFLGATNIYESKIVHKVYSDNIFIHPLWNLTQRENDIALISIPYTQFSTYIQSVKLPEFFESTKKYEGEQAIVTGWGITSDNNSSQPEILQYGEHAIISNEECSRHFSHIGKSNICIDTSDGTNTCIGDSGGPLVLQSTGVQVGLVSFGPINCTSGVPDAFTRVNSYLDWIEYHINDYYKTTEAAKTAAI